MSDDLRGEALNFLNDIIAAGEAQDTAEAIGFTISTVDPESGKQHLTGLFLDPVEAMRAANEHDVDVNDGNGPDDAPFVVSVLAVGGHEPTHVIVAADVPQVVGAMAHLLQGAKPDDNDRGNRMTWGRKRKALVNRVIDLGWW